MRTILIITLIFTTNVAYSQKYQPLIKENRYWIYDHYSHSSCFLMGKFSTEIRYFGSDTIVNSHVYKKLISSFVPVNKLPYEIKSKQTLCFMREDTLQRKVFLLNNDENVFPCSEASEVCVWDFSLKVGDSIPICLQKIFYPIDIEPFNHVTIDSIKNGNFYSFGFNPGVCGDQNPTRVQYVEGFGMEDGPIYKKYGTFLNNYCEGTLEQCNITTSTKEDYNLILNQLKIYPNPSDYNLIIQTDLNLKELFILNLNGEVVLKSQHKEIDVSGLVSGIYIVKYITSENEQYFKKFVKK